MSASLSQLRQTEPPARAHAASHKSDTFENGKKENVQMCLFYFFLGCANFLAVNVQNS